MNCFITLAPHTPVLPELHSAHIALIGAGNMVRALLQSLLRGAAPAAYLAIVNPDPTTCQRALTLGVETAGDGAAIIAGREVVILCCKPVWVRCNFR